MRAACSVPVVFQSALCCFALWPSAPHAEDIAERLNEAHERYEQSIEQIEQVAVTRLDELIDRYSDEGNLKKVLELRAQKIKLLEDRAWPESVVFRTMREKIRTARVRAKRELAEEYEDAIAALTKERKYDDAVALREELTELNEIQAAFDFRSEEPEQQKPEPDAIESKPKEKPPATNAVKPRAVVAPRPRKEAAKKPSGKGLAEILAAEAAKTPLDNPLATLREKEDAINSLISAFYKQLPPGQWSPQQCDEFIDFLAAHSAKVGWVAFPDLVHDGTSIAHRGDRIKPYPGIQWLVTSPTPKEFISRATHLQAKEYWPAVDKVFDVDDLKAWLGVVGCTNAARCKAVLEELIRADVQLAAIDQLSDELGK